MIFKEMKNGHLAQRVSQVLPIVFLLSWSYSGFPDHRHGSRSCTEVQTMMTAAAGLRGAALERGARFGPVPMERLHIEPFEPSFALEHSMWIVHNTKVSLALDRLIAVGKTGCALWLNDDSDPRELFRFMHTEGLVEDFAHRLEQLMELFLDLHKLILSLRNCCGV